MEVQVSKQVKATSDQMVAYWKDYVSGFNPEVKVTKTRNGFSIEGYETAAQNQYGRKVPAGIAGKSDPSHTSYLTLTFSDKDVVVDFKDSSRIGPTLVRPGEWKETVEKFAQDYNMKVTSIVETPDKKALLQLTSQMA
jgi:hypothetical protein